MWAKKLKPSWKQGLQGFYKTDVVCKQIKCKSGYVYLNIYKCMTFKNELAMHRSCYGMLFLKHKLHWVCFKKIILVLTHYNCPVHFSLFSVQEAYVTVVINGVDNQIHKPASAQLNQTSLLQMKTMCTCQLFAHTSCRQDIPSCLQIKASPNKTLHFHQSKSLGGGGGSNCSQLPQIQTNLV